MFNKYLPILSLIDKKSLEQTDFKTVLHQIMTLWCYLAAVSSCCTLSNPLKLSLKANMTGLF